MSAPLSEQELAAVIREYTPGLFHAVRAFTEDDGAAEDILQEVWIIAASAPTGRRAGMPLRGWLYGVALHRARSFRRRERRRNWLLALWRPPSTLPSEPESIEAALHHAALWRTVAALPRLQRDVVLLRIVEGLSTSGTAARLGRAEGTVKASLHRALAALRKANNFGER